MSRRAQPSGPILITSDSATQSTLVKKLLDDEFKNVITSTQPDNAAEDFDRLQPDVLVLAFSSFEKSERHNLGLYRLSQAIHLRPHRTIILCTEPEVGRAYELCRDEIFDDYSLFWPLTRDAPRLLMAVHHALRDLAVSRKAESIPADCAVHIRRVAELEQMLKQRLTQGDERIESTSRAIVQAELDIGTAISGFSERLAGGLSGMVEVRNAKALEQSFNHLKHDFIEAPVRSVAATVQPLKRWADELRRAAQPHLDAIRTLQAQAEHIQPVVLVVDDDEFQHKIIGRLLKDEGFQFVFVTSGLEALNMLRKVQPDLILMDLSMPGMDGLEVTRRVKGAARFTTIPIIMVTGTSEENIVTECLMAGANDFMVKPLSGDTLIAKMYKLLGTSKSPLSEPPADFNQADL